MIGIEGMKMPKNCKCCNLTACKGKDEPWNYVCSINLKDIDFNETERPEHCPLVEFFLSSYTMQYLTTAQMAKKWNISQRRVSLYCKDGRIPGAEFKGKTWLIPEKAVKPEDPRKKCKE